MKNALGAGVLLVSLAGCTRGPAPIEAPILGWQGEWGEWTAEDHAQKNRQLLWCNMGPPSSGCHHARSCIMGRGIGCLLPLV